MSPDPEKGPPRTRNATQFWQDVVTLERAHMLTLRHLLGHAPHPSAERELLGAIDLSARLVCHAVDQDESARNARA